MKRSQFLLQIEVRPKAGGEAPLTIGEGVPPTINYRKKLKLKRG